jgi:hypothetical protein
VNDGTRLESWAAATTALARSTQRLRAYQILEKNGWCAHGLRVEVCLFCKQKDEDALTWAFQVLEIERPHQVEDGIARHWREEGL